MIREEYKGRRITVDTVKVGRGYYYTYQIDNGRPIRQDGDRPLDKENALQEGLHEAKFIIDSQE